MRNRKIDKSIPRYWLPDGVKLKEGQVEQPLKNDKLIFIDEKYGEFVSTFKYLHQSKASNHPRAVSERRKNTVDKDPVKKADARNKAQNTMLKKYGFRHALQSNEFKNKAKETLYKNYGVDHPSKSSEIMNKIKETNIERYGVDNPAKILCSTRFIDGVSVSQLSKEENIPHCSLYRILRDSGEEVAKKWIENYNRSVSALELTFQELLPDIERYNKKVSQAVPFKPDFKYSDSFFIDVDGLIYHSEVYKKDKEYHLNKRKIFNLNNKVLLQFYQDEILKKPEIVKSIINAKIGNLSNKYFARKLEIREISSKEGSDFFEKTHLMGGLVSAKHIALFHDNKIVSCISYKKKNDGVDIARFSNDLETSVIGGLSRLLTYIIKKENPKFIQSFVDLRYGNGDSLKTLGFTLVSESLGWKWTDGYNTYNRLKCMANMDGRKLTEREYADELGWFKIYDAGQAKFVKYLK